MYIIQSGLTAHPPLFIEKVGHDPDVPGTLKLFLTGNRHEAARFADMEAVERFLAAPIPAEHMRAHAVTAVPFTPRGETPPKPARRAVTIQGEIEDA